MDITSYLLGKNSSGGGGGGSDLDWSAIGFNGRPLSIKEGYDYAVEIMNNWVVPISMSVKFKDNLKLMFMPKVDIGSGTSMLQTFYGCKNLTSVAPLDTSNITNINTAFMNCYSLRDVPIFDTSKITTMVNTFASCYVLTDTSLDNILQMCINATSYTGTKTLKNIGFYSEYQTASRIQALPHYQAFLDAGWTIGY